MDHSMSDDQRYPTGRFSSVKRPLTPAERAASIEAIRVHPKRIRAAVGGLSESQLDTPYRDGGWTVRQVVHHVVDSHTNAYIRFKLAITEDNPTVRPYQEKLWAELPDAKTMPVEASLSILDGIHARWAVLLESLAPEQFRRPLHHPEMGDITIDTLVELYGWHGAHHVAHITGLRARKGW
jgi:uncharacterized damage-inducible protein DinB